MMPTQVVRFTIRVLAFLTVVLLLLFLNVVFGPPLIAGGFMEAMADKHRLLNTVPSPRVVVIGGSNAAFGLDSDELERAFHRPVVNMAIHGGLGFEFMVNESIDGFRTGDLVLVMPEHVLFRTPRMLGVPFYGALDEYPEAFTFIPWSQRPKALYTFTRLKLTRTRESMHAGAEQLDTSVYRRSSFNAKGDVVGHLNMRPPGIYRIPAVELRKGFTVDPLFWTCVDRLLDRAEQVQFTVAFGWPSFARTFSVPAVDSLLEREMRARIPLVIGSPQTYIYPDSMFFDTRYHLQAEGRRQRTASFIADARRTLPPNWFRDP